MGNQKQTKVWINKLIYKFVLVMILLMANILYANDVNQSVLDGDLYKNRDYTELKELVTNVHASSDIKNLIINGWHFILMDQAGFNRNAKEANLFYKNGKYALISYFVDSEWNIEILDTAYVSPTVVPFRFTNGKKIYKDKNRSDFYSTCENNLYQGKKVIAIATPESKYIKLNCEHRMKKIKKAWLIDESNGQIGEISVNGVSCLYVAENECNF